MLPPLEIGAAAIRALKENGSIPKEEITVAVARMLGFQRTGPELRAKIDSIIAKMIKAGTVEMDQGWLARPRDLAAGIELKGRTQ